MRKSYSFILIFSLLFAFTAAFGQGYTFRVLANKGQNQVKKAGASAAVALKTGATLNADDELIVGNGSYIGLMHKTGKTIEVRTAGTQKVSAIEQKLAAKSTSVASKYAQFIASKMNEGPRTLASRMQATGAVSRATGSAAIEVMLPKDNNNTVEVFGNYGIISWLPPADADENIMYTVKVENIFDEVIYEDETAATSFELNFEEVPNETGLYLITIGKKGDDEIKSERFGIKKVGEEDMVELVENFEGLQSEVSDDSPLNKLIYASFFEENGLILDALTKYEEAIKLSPEIDDFKELKTEFLLNNGLLVVEDE